MVYLILTCHLPYPTFSVTKVLVVGEIVSNEQQSFEHCKDVLLYKVYIVLSVFM